jgi:hypothetical protein
MESRSCLETVPVGVPGLWGFIAPRPDLGSGRGPNQSCSPQRELSNAVSHSWSARRERVDSWLLVVGSQIASLTPDPSFAHNLGCRCPNDQCKAIFDIYVSRPFQWHQERLNASCFGPCCRALNIRESWRTPNPPLFQVLGFTPHLAKVGLRHIVYLILKKWLWNPHIGKLERNTVGMGVHKIIKQMGKTDPKNYAKIIILEKWLVVTSNWKCYIHPPITPPNLGVNLTSFKCHEPLFHTRHKSLHEMDEN